MSMPFIPSCGKFPDAHAKIPPRVLVVDDEPLVRWALVTGLRHAGYDAVPASGLDEALALMAPPPDLVLLDLRLWGRQPDRVLEAIRSAAPGSRILLLVVEGQEVPVAGWRDVDVIRKPFDLNAVIRQAGEALARPWHDVRVAV
jgi:DNA-binding response OmpR family regulator